MASSRTSAAEGSIVGQIIQSQEAGCSELEEESGVLVLEPRFRLCVFGEAARATVFGRFYARRARWSTRARVHSNICHRRVESWTGTEHAGNDRGSSVPGDETIGGPSDGARPFVV